MSSSATFTPPQSECWHLNDQEHPKEVHRVTKWEWLTFFDNSSIKPPFKTGSLCTHRGDRGRATDWENLMFVKNPWPFLWTATNPLKAKGDQVKLRWKQCALKSDSHFKFSSHAVFSITFFSILVINVSERKTHPQLDILASAFAQNLCGELNRPHGSFPSTAIFMLLLSQTQHDRYFQSATMTAD